MAETRAINFSDPINRGHSLNRGRVAWWLTLPGSVGGGTWRDITNNKNTGVLTAMGNASNGFRPTNRPGGWGQILGDGTAGYIDCGTSNSLATPAITVAIWVNAKSLSNTYSAAIGRVNASQYYQIFVKSSGKLAMFVRASNVGGINYDGTGNTTLSVGAWYRLVLTYDSVAGLAGYVNAKIDGSAAANGSLIVGNALSLSIGTDLNTAGRYWNGFYDDACVWNRALSATEILQDYNLSQRGYPGVLNRHHWPMNFAAVAGGGNHFRRTNQFAKRTGCRQST